MFKKLNVSNSGNFDKSNFKFLKLITIILAILILICLVLLIFGFVKNYNKLSSKNEITKTIQETDEFEIFQPENSQLISSSIGGDERLLLRYQSEGNNVIIIIDTNRKIILKKIFFRNGKDWKIN